MTSTPPDGADTSGIKMPSIAASLIRTWVPIAAGAVLTWVGAWSDVAFSPETSASVGAFTAMAAAALYYGLARAFESARGDGGINPALRRIGRFMLGGVVSKPVYLTEEEYERLRRLSGGAAGL